MTFKLAFFALPPQSAPSPVRLHALVAGCMLLASGCRKQAPRSVHVPQMAQGFDNSAIDAAHLDEDAAARHHVLNMGAQETAARLQAFVWRNQTTILLSQNNREVSQMAHAAMLAQDDGGGLHLQTGNGKSQLELFAVGPRAYVRQDRGHLRHKRRQEMDIAEMVEAATASLRQMLQHFPGVTLTHPEPISHDGRAAVRYALDLSGAQDATLSPQPSLRVLPIAAPSRWREEAKNPHIDGHVVVDSKTGVVLRAEATGTLALTGQDGASTQLTLRCLHTIGEVGKLASIREPQNSIAEFRRPIRPHDPLSFYRAAQWPAAHPGDAAANGGRVAGPSAVPNSATSGGQSDNAGAPADGPPPEDSPLDDAPPEG